MSEELLNLDKETGKEILVKLANLSAMEQALTDLFHDKEDFMIELCKILNLDYTLTSEKDVLAEIEKLVFKVKKNGEMP